MSKPYIHAVSSAKKFGGKWEDYISIHSLFDISKGAIADHRHRMLTHNAFFIGVLLERIPFPNSAPPVGGLYTTIINSDGKHVSVRDIGEQHCLEDFNGFIPTLNDYADHMEMASWMNNGKGEPNSILSIKRAESQTGKRKTEIKFVPFDNQEKKTLDVTKKEKNTLDDKPINLDEIGDKAKKVETKIPSKFPYLPENIERPMYHDDVAGPIHDPWARDPDREEYLENMVMDGANNPDLGGSRHGEKVMDEASSEPRRSRRSDFLID